MARQRHTMTRVRWVLLAVGTALLALVVLLADSVTLLFTAGFAYLFGVIILLASERIIASTRNDPATRLANARQGTIDR
jgi:predicted anti-sigma-YlaC factor YlaD